MTYLAIALCECKSRHVTEIVFILLVNLYVVSILFEKYWVMR